MFSTFGPPQDVNGSGTLVIYRAPDAIVVNGPNRHLRLGSDASIVNLGLGSSFQALAPLTILSVHVGDSFPSSR